jgi:hypothetical protein
LRHYATSQKVAGSSPDEVDFFNLPNPYSRIVALGSTQPLTEMSTRNFPGGKGRLVHKADNFTAICEPTVWKTWEPWRLTTLWAPTACYRNNFTFTFFLFPSVLPIHLLHIFFSLSVLIKWIPFPIYNCLCTMWPNHSQCWWALWVCIFLLFWKNKYIYNMYIYHPRQSELGHNLLVMPENGFLLSGYYVIRGGKRWPQNANAVLEMWFIFTTLFLWFPPCTSSMKMLMPKIIVTLVQTPYW